MSRSPPLIPLLPAGERQARLDHTSTPCDSLLRLRRAARTSSSDPRTQRQSSPVRDRQLVKVSRPHHGAAALASGSGPPRFRSSESVAGPLRRVKESRDSLFRPSGPCRPPQRVQEDFRPASTSGPFPVRSLPAFRELGDDSAAPGGCQGIVKVDFQSQVRSCAPVGGLSSGPSSIACLAKRVPPNRHARIA